MFKIQPIQSKEEQIRIAELCGASYIEGYFAYSMIEDDGTLLGFSQFDIRGEDAYISDIKSAIGIDDEEAMIILGRSTMNFIDMCGTHIAYAPSTCADKAYMIRIGFTPNDDGYFANMEHYFSGCSH